MKHPIPRLIPLATMAAIVLAAATGIAGPLPPLIDFQSVLLDEGGNLLPSGSTSVQFQILDENRAPIYTEVQSVDVVKGATSALIGNGSDAKGISTGGIPDDIFATGAPRYLQVQVDGRTPEDPMTIVPVPYSQWSQTCASVADGGVKPASIAKAAVGFESLAPDVVSKLAEALSNSQGVVTAQTLGGTGGALQIGVEAKLINSGSSSVQGVLQDIDLAVKKRQEESQFLTGRLNEEVSTRTNAINGVLGTLNQEIVNRSAADNGLQTQLTKESATRTSQINTINSTLTDINTIPGILNPSKLPPSPAISPMPPILSGDISWGEFTFYKYSGGSTQVSANISEGIAFIPFDEPEILAQNTCGDTSGHACNFATIPADNTLYLCKVGIKFDLQGHLYASGGGVHATCEYTTRASPSSLNDNDGGNLDYAVQKGILIHIYDLPKGMFGFSASTSVRVLYALYQIPVAPQ